LEVKPPYILNFIINVAQIRNKVDSNGH